MALSGTIALCTLGELKLALGIANADTSRDSVLEGRILAASERIEGYCSRTFGRAVDVAEKLRGAGWPRLLPDRTPVESVTSCTIDGVAVDVTQLEVVGKTRNMVEWPEAAFPWAARLSGDGIAQGRVPGTERQNVTLTYTGGYHLPNDGALPSGATALPYAIREACVVLAADMDRRLTRDASVVAEAVGEASVQLAASAAPADAMALAFPPYVRNLLAPYFRGV